MIKWNKQTVSPGRLHLHLSRALSEIINGDPSEFLCDSIVPIGTVRTYLQQAILFNDYQALDALVANLRNAVFDFENNVDGAPR